MRWTWLLLLGIAAAPAEVPAVLAMATGERVPLDTWRGRVVVLDFWATWCAPCRAELAELDAYAAAHRDRLTAVAVLAEAHPDARLVAATTASLHLPIARFASGGARFPLRFGAVPTTYVLDRAGVVVLVQTGPFPPGALRARLDPLLAAAP